MLYMQSAGLLYVMTLRDTELIGSSWYVCSKGFTRYVYIWIQLPEAAVYRLYLA